MANLQTLYDLADPKIRKIWDEKDNQLSKRLEYADLGFTDYQADILNPYFENFSGLGIAGQTGEKEPYSREDLAQAYQINIQPVKYTKAIDISEEMLRFNLWPKINNLVGATANSLNHRINLDATKILYLGFGTTVFTGGDAVALFSASHPTGSPTTGSQTNTLGTVSLTYDNLKTATQYLDRAQDDKGVQLLPCRKLRLIVARENKEKAQEVLRSIGNPDNANRVNNVFNNGDGYIDMRVANWIPSTTYSKYWFVVDMERAAYMAFMVWGWKPKFDSDNVVNNGTKIYTASVMEKPGFSSWQWVTGSAATA
jgi:hypothetical protein